MSVWYCTPSARPKAEAEAVFRLWLDHGVKLCILRQGDPLDLPNCTQFLADRYHGLPICTNLLMKTAAGMDQEAQWFAFGGDDYLPDPNLHASWIADDCTKHFAGTFGVMQPTGDRYGNGYIDTAAASAWIGRDFVLKSYGGSGPLYTGYHHLYCDTELQHVATMQGVFQQRQDITQEHKHWSRPGNVKPAFADSIYGFNADNDRALFIQRQLNRFPGC